jgi:cytochrome c55X
MLQSTACLAEEGVSHERQMELVRLVRNDCGSCHGLRLNGGLGPALMPAALAGKALEGLRETILRGRAGTAMPPWSSFLSEADANWIVEQLMKGFPDVH